LGVGCFLRQELNKYETLDYNVYIKENHLYHEEDLKNLYKKNV